LLRSSQETNEGLKLLYGDLITKEHVEDSQGVGELQGLLEVSILSLIKGAFQKKGLLGTSKKKEIAIVHSLSKPCIELVNMFFKEFMAAR
jgi:hypothetical protein